MLGVVGMLLLEILIKIGIINVATCYDARNFIWFHYMEIRRWKNIENLGSMNKDPIFKNYIAQVLIVKHLQGDLQCWHSLGLLSNTTASKK
uniref:Uncharacterized protein n=1 Tax=Nelumbo nucifera TaxID=4432 RepID=A0A822YDA0_NELNU|nr:TPA_asm: hypothetical protein HUJ06_030504 [Nelumbo nucifera]